MLKRIIAIVVIFVCTAVAWAILGSTIFYRTYNAESGLAGRVASTWGAPQGQAPPAIAYEWPEEKTVEVEEKGKKITRTERQMHSEAVKIDASRVAAAFHIDYRQKGLLWFSTYKVDFDGAYTFQNPSSREEEFVFRLPFPAQQAVYDNVQMLLDDKPLALTFSGSQAVARTRTGARREVRAEGGLSLAGARQLAIHLFKRERRRTAAGRKFRRRATFTCW